MKMDKKTLAILMMVGSIGLSACGQRPESSNNFLGAANAATEGINVRVITNVYSITTGGTEAATITALVTDENNNALSDTEVVFTSSSGVLQDVSNLTDENGEVTATLKVPSDFQNQNIMVTAVAEGNSSSAFVATTGSVLDVSGPDNLVMGDQVEIVLSLTAGNDEPIANHEVSVVSQAGNTITPTVPYTGSDGRVTVLVGTERGDDVVDISALSGTVTATHIFEVSQDLLQFAEGTVDSELPVAQDNPITVTWTSQSIPVVGGQLLFTTTAGEIVGESVVTTDANGQATIQLRSSSYGPAKVTVEDALDSRPTTSVDVEFIATVPASVFLDASVTRVAANDSSTLMATVTDANGNPVKNQLVEFTGVDLKGGQISPASARSNTQGIASVTYTAGANATETDDVEIAATVKNTTISSSMFLSVVERVLNVTLGTSNLLQSQNFDTQYSVSFVVQVADGSGTPLENAVVEFSIRPLEYVKGVMQAYPEEFVSDARWYRDESIVCATEDANGNRLLDEGEDLNGNGSLDPQDPALLSPIIDNPNGAATILGGTLTTDSSGSGFFELHYPKSNALWSTIEITAYAQALGAEAQSSFETQLSLSAVDVAESGVSPPNRVSPYGTSASCLDTL